jgi:hypothetical protein
MRWFLLLALVLAPVSAHAQAPGQTPPLGAQQPPPPTTRQERQQERQQRQQQKREDIKQRIRALRAYTLTEELALDEQTAGKLFPMLAKFDEEFDKLLQQRQDLQKRLNASGDVKDPKAVDKLIDEAIANQRALWDTEDKRLAQLRKILTPAQVARVLVVLPAMERKIQNQLRKAVQRPNQPRNVDPFADDDEAPAPRPRQRKQQKAAPGGCDPFTGVGCE